MSKTRQRISSVIAIAALTAGAAVFTATPASALGNNRTVERSCGKNYVSSGFVAGVSWAQTRRQEGTCAGRLSAALESNDGFWSQRVYGDRNEAYASASFGSAARYGLHWGCDDCNVTRS